MPLTDINQLLVSEVQGMREDFRGVSRELGELAQQVKALAADQAVVRDVEKRLTILETQHKTTAEWVDNARTNTRWLVALAIGSFLSALAIVLNTFLKH